MKNILKTCLLLFSCFIVAQTANDRAQIKITLNNYIDGFYEGDTLKLKKALKPRLYKFGYLKDKETGSYNYYQHLSFDNALKLAQRFKDEGRLRTETKMRSVKVLEVANHIAAAKVTAAWGIDYVLLSKDNGRWMIEEVIWEGPFLEKYKKENPTTYYLIRHAEKDQSDKSNRNPHLTDEGLKRAENWSKILANVKFDKIYSTNYHRTLETAKPTADFNNLDVTLYDPRNFDLEKFKSETHGKTILIVGHSNTTPYITNQLLEEKKYKMIDESNNGHLYIVTISNDKSSSSLLQID